MNQIEVTNFLGKKLPDHLDQPEKTIFFVNDVPARGALLLLHPLERSIDECAAGIASAAIMDEGTIRAKLSRRGFMLLKRCDAAEDVTAAVAKLTSQGIRARMMRENMFFRIVVPRRTISAQFGRGSISFFLAGNPEPIVISAGEPVFLVIGDLRSLKRRAAVMQSDERGVSPSPDSGRVFTEMLDKINTYICDFYFPYKWLTLRIQSDRFNFSCIGQVATEHSAENLAVFLDRLSSVPLKMVWDDRFPETALIGMKSHFDLLESRSSLIPASLFTTPEEAPFNMYSRMRYIIELASGLKCFS